MKVKLLNTSRTRRHNIAGKEAHLLGKKSGIIYFMIEQPDYAIYYSVDEDSLKKHATSFDESALLLMSSDDLILISKSLSVF